MRFTVRRIRSQLHLKSRGYGTQLTWTNDGWSIGQVSERTEIAPSAFSGRLQEAREADPVDGRRPVVYFCRDLLCVLVHRSCDFFSFCREFRSRRPTEAQADLLRNSDERDAPDDVSRIPPLAAFRSRRPDQPLGFVEAQRRGCNPRALADRADAEQIVVHVAVPSCNSLDFK